MKGFLLLLITITLVSMRVSADSFQVYYQVSNNYYYVAYEAYQLTDGSNKTIFSGYTDKFGRFAVRVKPGYYTCLINYQKKQYSIRILVDNSRGIKKHYISTPVQKNILSKKAG